MSNAIRNRTYNQIFEIEGDPDYLYVINSNNDVFTNETEYPYFGEITIFRAQTKPYMKTKDSSFRRESKRKEE